MPYELVRNDITLMKVDAIVNAANESLLGGGGVDGAIHRAAGPGLLEECCKLNGCATGDAKVTGAYDLPCRYVIHTVGPIWRGGGFGEEEKLISCYKRSLALAKEKGCKTVAFPLISAGVYGYPKDRALKTAMDTIGDFLLENDMLVYIVIFDSASFIIGEKLRKSIAQFIDESYVDKHADDRRTQFERMRRVKADRLRAEAPMPMGPERADFTGAAAPRPRPRNSLELMLSTLDESFQQMVLRKIDEKGMKDAECYKRANIDRKLFSKIRGDVYYRPSKRTAVALAIALELPRDEFDDMLEKAGYALSNSTRFDVIIQYFIKKGIYDINTINMTLFEYDQQLLGA